MRAVLDANVLISAILSPRGTPARLLLAWQAGEFDLVASPKLLAELRRALTYPKLERLVSPADADAFVAWIARSAIVVSDPDGPPPVRSVDPGDDYLLALAAAERALLVSGHADLTALGGQFPVRTPAEFLAELRLPNAWGQLTAKARCRDKDPPLSRTSGSARAGGPPLQRSAASRD